MIASTIAKITLVIVEVVKMILVDTSVMIDKLRKVENEKTILFDRHISSRKQFSISVFTFHEILQGAESDADFKQLFTYFSTQKIYTLPNTVKAYAESARLCFDLQQQGLTSVSTIETLIAHTAIQFKLPLLHNDEIYDKIAEINTNLKIYV